MFRLCHLAFLTMLLVCALGWAQTTPLDNAPVTDRGSLLPQPDAQPAKSQAHKELPTSPGTSLEAVVKAGMKAQPYCQQTFRPCALTPRQKLKMFENKSYSPFTFLNAGFDAGSSQIFGDGYGPGIRGIAQRYGANLADTESRSFFQTYLFSTIFHQDPRYHPLRRGGLLCRASYAASRVLVGRTDAGGSALNWPEIFGTAATIALGNAYYPDRDRGAVNTINRVFGSMASDAETNVVRELWPDLRKILFRHEPKSLQRVEQKIGAMSDPSRGARRSSDPGR